MNIYFSKVTADYWCNKNKLQEEAQKVARDMERKILSQSAADDFTNELYTRIAQLNQKFNRCKPLQIEKAHAYQEDDKDKCFIIPSVFHLTLYLVKQ